MTADISSSQDMLKCLRVSAQAISLLHCTPGVILSFVVTFSEVLCPVETVIWILQHLVKCYKTLHQQNMLVFL